MGSKNEANRLMWATEKEKIFWNNMVRRVYGKWPNEDKIIYNTYL